MQSASYRWLAGGSMRRTRVLRRPTRGRGVGLRRTV